MKFRIKYYVLKHIVPVVFQYLLKDCFYTYYFIFKNINKGILLRNFLLVFRKIKYFNIVIMSLLICLK